LQQVGLRVSPSPIIVDMRRGPALVRRRNPRIFGNVSRLWVLRRVLILRICGALICAALLATVFQTRGGIGQALQSFSAVMQGEFVDAGFGIDKIEISGQVLTPESRIIATLGIKNETSTLNFSAEEARQKLLGLPAVSEVSVRRVYPNQLVIKLEEKVPVARWRIDGITFLVDAAGERIGVAAAADSKLPLVIGDNAANDAVVITRALERYPSLNTGLAALSRIADRRWDLLYKTGLRVKLPETGVAQALVRLDRYQTEYQLLDRDVKLIDLRVANVLTVRPVEADGLAGEETSGAIQLPSIDRAID
jgi:cell division protein FtsQ